MSPASTNSSLRMLIINPNTSLSMTEALKPMVLGMGYSNVEYSFFTSPTPGVPSIDSPLDAENSAHICFPHLLPLLPHHDVFLVACYSQHPLLNMLRFECIKHALGTAGAPEERAPEVSRQAAPRIKYVNSIFEVSVTASLTFLMGEQRFGIISTAKVWEKALNRAVHEFLGTSEESGVSRYAGCETTGLNAIELHDLPFDTVKGAMKEATVRLLTRGSQSNGKNDGHELTGNPVQAICLGCAGMAGLDDAIREACVETLGKDKGRLVQIIDGVKAGVANLVGLSAARC